MKRTAVATAVLLLTAATAGGASANGGQGNGVKKSGLAAKTFLITCSPASAAEAGKQTAHGFAVLNGAGKPGAAHKIVRELALKNAQPGTYDARLVSSPGGCGTSVGTLVVGQNGNGNAVIAASGGSGTWHVVLTKPVADGLPVTVQHDATAPVTLK